MKVPTTKAFDLGWDAANNYKNRIENPYDPGTEEYEDWDQGWEDAMSDMDDEGDEE